MKPDPFHPLQRAPDLSVRPAFRVVGAILLMGVAALFIFKGMAVFSQEITTLASCDREGKGRLWCELGKLLLAQMPASARGPALSAAAFATAAGALLLCWWLLRPVFGPTAPSQTKLDEKRDGH